MRMMLADAFNYVGFKLLLTLNEQWRINMLAAVSMERNSNPCINPQQWFSLVLHKLMMRESTLEQVMN